MKGIAHAEEEEEEGDLDDFDGEVDHNCDHHDHDGERGDQTVEMKGGNRSETTSQ